MSAILNPSVSIKSGAYGPANRATLAAIRRALEAAFIDENRGGRPSPSQAIIRKVAKMRKTPAWPDVNAIVTRANVG